MATQAPSDVSLSSKRAKRLMRTSGISGLVRVKRGKTTIRVASVRATVFAAWSQQRLSGLIVGSMVLVAKSCDRGRDSTGNVIHKTSNPTSSTRCIRAIAAEETYMTAVRHRGRPVDRTHGIQALQQRMHLLPDPGGLPVIVMQSPPCRDPRALLD